MELEKRITETEAELGMHEYREDVLPFVHPGEVVDPS